MIIEFKDDKLDVKEIAIIPNNADKIIFKSKYILKKCDLEKLSNELTERFKVECITINPTISIVAVQTKENKVIKWLKNLLGSFTRVKHGKNVDKLI